MNAILLSIIWCDAHEKYLKELIFSKSGLSFFFFCFLFLSVKVYSFWVLCLLLIFPISFIFHFVAQYIYSFNKSVPVLENYFIFSFIVLKQLYSAIWMIPYIEITINTMTISIEIHLGNYFHFFIAFFFYLVPQLCLSCICQKFVYSRFAWSSGRCSIPYRSLFHKEFLHLALAFSRWSLSFTDTYSAPYSATVDNWKSKEENKEVTQ